MTDSWLVATETSYGALEKPVTVISHLFCRPNLLDLTIGKKLAGVNVSTDGNFAAVDGSGNVLFSVKVAMLSLRERRVLLDPNGRTVVSLQHKILTAHKRWQVYRGDSADPEEMLFSARRSSMYRYKSELDVFLSSNTKEDVCDFKVKGSWLERNCVIYSGDCSTVIAQMQKKHDFRSVGLGEDSFTLTVYPNIDHAFIVALVVIMDEINDDMDDANYCL